MSALEQEHIPENQFTEFQNVDDEDDNLMQQSPRVKERWIKSKTTLYLLDLIFCSLSPTVIWRLPPVAFAMALSWDRKTVDVWTFLLPYVVCLVCVAWPLLVAEIGLGQCVRGCSYKAFGSLGRHAGASGIVALSGSIGCFITSLLGALSFLYLLRIGDRGAAYKRADTSVDGPRMCLSTMSFAPYMNPRVCVTEPAWWTGDLSTGMYEGEGKCVAAPWGGSSTWYFDAHNSELPQIFQELPLYCGDINLHKATTDSAYALITRDANWSDTNSHVFLWRMLVGFLVLWAAVLILCLLPQSVGQIVRVIMGTSAIAFLSIIFIATIIWYSQNPYRKVSWLKDFVYEINWSRLKKPEIWAHAVIQSLLSLNVSQNAVVSTAMTSPNPKSNIVTQASLIMAWNTLFSYLILWMIFLGYLSLTQNQLFTRYDPWVTISHQIRNNAYGLTFSLMQTLFDNSSSLDGTSPRSLYYGFTFWLAVFVLSVLSVYQMFAGLVDTAFRAKFNWKLGWNKRVWCCVLALGNFVLSCGCWFGIVWSLYITVQHFLINWGLPVFTLIELLSLGWFFGFAVRGKHYGKRSPLIQAFLYFLGLIVFGLCAAANWDAQGRWKWWTGLLMGGLLIIASFTIPVLLVKSHDIYGRKTSLYTRCYLVIFGSTDHLRKEFNYRTCHQRSVWKLTPVWSILVRYIAPWLVTVSWFAFWARKDQNWNFSPYRPFFNDQTDLFARMERQMMSYFGDTVFQYKRPVLAVAWACSLAIPLGLIFHVVWIKFFSLMVPPDTDPNFWNVRQALELFASSVAHTQVPVRVRSNEGLTPQSAFVSALSPNSHQDTLKNRSHS
eukprot:Blabericola_migrator_1__7631@NODE_38_length_17790_cov_195_231733_g34_i0_p3_GENE_NODE_38_length_17790_cov_195_231733_g34_i0NODE_38_length_17790_cov_195_231733_g34_i0_p3_ORF_typecomplete_len833_score116_35SNF/PF00209_18/1_2e03SNF/PF00209_18/2e14SNF/PF00209_18/38DUF2663/PF10864_8/0_34DUF2663/PF10864_8/7_1e02DUF2663/PF10864_8/6e02_NODE_38_length_17790_cov_195_231733_g34_i015484046